MRSAGILGVEVGARRCPPHRLAGPGIPRIANRLLRRVRDFVEVAPGCHRRHRSPPGPRASSVWTMLGLDKVDRVHPRRVVPSFRWAARRCRDPRPLRGGGARHRGGRYEPYLPPAGLLATHRHGGGFATRRAFATSARSLRTMDARAVPGCGRVRRGPPGRGDPGVTSPSRNRSRPSTDPSQPPRLTTVLAQASSSSKTTTPASNPWSRCCR